MFLLGNIAGGIKGDYISRSAGIYPGSYGFNLLSPRPCYEPARGRVPGARSRSEGPLQTPLRPHRSPSGLPFSPDRRWQRPSPSRPAHGPRALREAKPRAPPGPPAAAPLAQPPQQVGSGAAPAPTARPAAHPSAAGPGRAAAWCSPAESRPFLCRKEKLPPPPGPRIFHLQCFSGGRGRGQRARGGVAAQRGSRAANKAY